MGKFEKATQAIKNKNIDFIEDLQNELLIDYTLAVDNHLEYLMEDLNTKQQSAITNTIITSIFILLISIAFGYRISKSIQKPINSLKRATKQIARGDLNISIDNPSEDELGVLSQSFNHMVLRTAFSQHNISV